MSTDCTVLIAPTALLAEIKERVGVSDGELLTFADVEPLRALSIIMKRKPKVVAIERLYAATSRGATLINRIKADPKLTKTEIRIIAHNSDYMRVSPRKPVAAAQPLDQRGTRRAPRFKVDARAVVRVDGTSGTLVELSAVGAQIVTTGVLKPGQRVRLELDDTLGVLDFGATVIWASFEIPPDSGPRYRAGFDFVDAEGPAVEAFCRRHQT